MGQTWGTKNIPSVLQLAKISGLGNFGQEPLFGTNSNLNFPNLSSGFAQRCAAAPAGRGAHFGQLDEAKSAHKGSPGAG